MPLPIAISIDPQTAGVFALVAAAIVYLAFRAVSFMRKAAAGNASACGGCVSNCTSNGNQPKQLVTLESVGSFPRTPK